jgi:LacI family transcriptional regulator
MTECVNHLVERGYSRLVYISPYDFASLEKPDPRVSSYFSTCNKRGIDALYQVLPVHEETARVGLEIGLEFAAMKPSRRPDAIVAHNDVVAIGIYNGLTRGGLNIPGDIALTGCDGIEFGQILAKPLTTIGTPPGPMIDAALSIIKQRIENSNSPRVQTVLPAKLIVGETT